MKVRLSVKDDLPEVVNIYNEYATYLYDSLLSFDFKNLTFSDCAVAESDVNNLSILGGT